MENVYTRPSLSHNSYRYLCKPPKGQQLQLLYPGVCMKPWWFYTGENIMDDYNKIDSGVLDDYARSHEADAWIQDQTRNSPQKL